MKYRSREEMQGIFEDIKEILRPTDAEGNVEPMGTVKVQLTNETKMYFGLLLAGGIVFGIVVNKIAG